MAIAKVQKIQLIATKKHKHAILEALQNTGATEIKELAEDSPLAIDLSDTISELQKTFL